MEIADEIPGQPQGIDADRDQGDDGIKIPVMEIKEQTEVNDEGLNRPIRIVDGSGPEEDPEEPNDDGYRRIADQNVDEVRNFAIEEQE